MPSLLAMLESRPGIRDLLAFLLAAAAYLWCLSLHFQYDDVWLLPVASRQMAEFGSQLLGSDPIGLPLSIRHLFQPVLWATHVIEIGISGEPLQPWVFHLTSILLHGLNCVLLRRLLARFVPGPAELMAVSLFAIHPGGAQAISWTVARGDLMVVGFTLGAFLLVLRPARQPGTRPFFLAGLMMLLALGCKPTAVSLTLPLVLVAMIAQRQGQRSLAKRIQHALMLLLPVALGILVRARFLGGYSVDYIYGVRLNLEQVPAMVGALPKVLGYILVPWNQVGEHAALAPWLGSVPAWVFVALWCLMGVLGLGRLVLGRLMLGRLLWGMAVVALVLAPALYHWQLFPESRGIFLSRSLYPVLAASAYCLAVVVAPLWASGPGPGGPGRGWPRGLAWLCFAILIGLCADGQRHVAGMELEAARLVRARLSAIEEELSTHRDSEPDITLAVTDPQPLFLDIMMLNGQLGSAFKPPFRATRARVRFLARTEGLMPLFPDEFSGPFKVLRWNVKSERLVAVSDVVPAVTEDLSLVRRAPASPGENLFVPEHSIVPRSVGAITFSFKDREELRGQVVCRVKTERTEIRRTVSVEAGRGICSFQKNMEFFLSRELVSISVKAEPTSLGMPEVVLENRLPRLRLLSSPNETTLTSADEPLFVFESLWSGHGLRLSFHVEVGWHKHRFQYLVPHAALTVKPDGSLSYTPSSEHVDPGTPYFSAGSWKQAVDGLLEDFSLRFGVDQVKVTWTLHSVDPVSGGSTAAGGSGWFLLRR